MSYFKIAVMALMVVFILSAVPQTVYAQSSKQDAKLEKINQKASYKNAKTEAKKAASNFKNKVKQLEKEGYKIAGDHRTLELAIIEFQNKLDANNGKLGAFAGEVSKCRSIDACKQMAQFQAQRQLATDLNAEMEGIALGLLEVDEVTADESNTLTTGFKRKTQADVSGLITPSFSLIKANGDGTNTYITFYFVDLDRMSRLRKSALEASLKEANIAIEKAERIRNFVEESLKDE